MPLRKQTRQTKLIVGLTGGVATGKTTFAYVFKQLGAQVICCDELAHRALRRGTQTYRAIVKTFGKRICDRNKRIERTKLAACIFRNKRKRKRLENIIHPFVFEKVFQVIRQGKGIVIIDIPLLFETGFQKQVDRTIVISCRYHKQVSRLMTRDKLSRKQAQTRIKAQMPLAHKRALADWVIDNTVLKKAVHNATRIWKIMNTLIV